MISIQIGFYANISQRPILKEIGLILNNKIREWINIRSTISRYLHSVEHQLTWRKKTTVVQWSVVNNFILVIINLHPQEKGQESCVPLQFGLLSGNIFRRIYSRLTSRKASLFETWCLFKRKVSFSHLFWYEERQERGKHEPLVSLRRPGSTEQA